jgi:MFS family permease
MKMGQISGRNFNNIVASFAAIAACDIAFGLTLQLQPLLMEAEQIPARTIGAMVSMGPLGILLAGPFLPRIIAKFGSKSVAVVAVATILALLFVFKLTSPLYAWFALRFAFGIAVGSLFTVSETWVLTFSNDQNRGRIMGLYTSMLSVTFGLGPVLLPFTGIQGWLPWIIGAICVAISFAPLFFVKIVDTPESKQHGNVWTVLRLQPLIFSCAIAATMFDSIMVSFFTIFGIRNGLELEKASTILGFGIIACVFFYYPLGILADRWSRSGVIVVCSCVTVVAALFLTPAINTIMIWPLVLLLCVSAFGVYVVAMAAIGDAFKGPDLVAASAAISATWGVGGLVGPSAAGSVIDFFGAAAFPILLSAIYVCLSLGLATNRWHIVRRVTP